MKFLLLAVARDCSCTQLLWGIANQTLEYLKKQRRLQVSVAEVRLHCFLQCGYSLTPQLLHTFNSVNSINHRILLLLWVLLAHHFVLSAVALH